MQAARTKKSMRDFLRVLRAHDDMAALVLSKGEWFDGKAEVDDYEITKAWKKERRPTAKQCFYNAQTFCMEHVEHRYFEGYALIAGIPMPHAWVVMDDGKVVDFTLEAMLRKAKRERAIVDERPPLYYGVEVPRKFIVQRIVESGHSEPIAERYYLQ
jgi:hypothetical protein